MLLQKTYQDQRARKKREVAPSLAGSEKTMNEMNPNKAASRRHALKVDTRVDLLELECLGLH